MYQELSRIFIDLGETALNLLQVSNFVASVNEASSKLPPMSATAMVINDNNHNNQTTPST